MRILVLAISSVLLLAGCGSQTAAPTTSAKEATHSTADHSEAAAPADAGDKPGTDGATADALKFTGTTVDGAAFDGATLAGKPSVLWFWAPWCPTCQGQAPNVSALAKKYDGQVNVVGIAGLSDSQSDIAAFADNTSGVTNLSDSPGEIWKKFGIIEQSVYVVIGADGTIIKEGGYLEDSELNDLVASLV